MFDSRVIFGGDDLQRGMFQTVSEEPPKHRSKHQLRGQARTLVAD